jgi:hypothetical protein
MAPIFGRILRVTLGEPLTVPIYVPAAWAKEFITVELADETGVSLASTLSGRGAFSAPNVATRSFMARDVELHLGALNKTTIKVVARCSLGCVSEPVRLAIS